MKRIVSTTFIALVLLALPALAASSTWHIDPAHSEVGFKVRHMMVSNVRGEFTDVKGTVEYDEADITRSTIDVTIQAGSVDTGVEKRDNHLRSPDFFDAEKFPTLTFRSAKVMSVSDGRLQVVGNLTIHGITKEVTLDVEGPTQQVKDPWGNVKMGAFATTKINRKDFGLTWNKALEAGGWVVGEGVTIELELELLKVVDKGDVTKK
jgi:polyisoprenoid-binding protein YceI